MKKRTIVLICAVFVLVFFILWENGTIGVYQQGMAFFMKNSPYTTNYKKMDLVVESEIDLYNLESNSGKIIYDDGQCTIEIVLVRKEESENYNAFFRAHGIYNRSGGTLISAIRQNKTEDGYYNADCVGKMQVIVENTAYDSKNSGLGGLNYKDGDVFGFYLFPLECYNENGELLLDDSIKNQNGKVKIRLSNLNETTWARY